MRKIIFLLLLISFSVLSCKKDIEVPSYIHVKAPEFRSKSGQGTDLHNIIHVGVFINDNLEGIFEAPVTLPVLREGDVVVELRPYVKRLAREGLTNYTLMDGYRESTTLEKTKVDTVSPIFEYQGNTKFDWLDDFNANTKSIFIDTNQSSIDTIFITNNSIVGVDSSLYAFLDMSMMVDPFFSVETEDQFELPSDGRDVYLEFHYNSNIPLLIGLYEYDGNGDFVATLPSVQTNGTSGEWLKGYVYLNDELINSPVGTKYKVFIRGINGDDGISARVFLDNFKLMYRE